MRQVDPRCDQLLVVHLIDSLRVGGAQTHLLTMLREDVGTGKARHAVLSLFDDGPIGGDLRALGVPVEVLGLTPLLKRRRFRAAADRIADCLREQQPAIVEAHLTYSRILGLFAAWRAGVPIRVAFEPGDIYLNSWKFRLANFASQFWADRIVPCSNALAKWDRRAFGFRWSKMYVLHNCVDIDRFSMSNRSSTNDFNERPDCQTVFCAIGTLGSGVNKRMDVCISAIAEARRRGADVGLIIVGDGPLRPELEQLRRDLGVSEVVKLLGLRNDTPDILANCDVFCHAAPFEPFGIVALEAMAMGLPVIVPDSGGIREAVDDGVTGYTYPPLDHSALAERMVQLHANVALRARMGQAARDTVEQRFSSWRYISDLRDLYALIAREKGL